MTSRSQSPAQRASQPRRRLFVAFSIKGYVWFWASMFWSAAGMSGRMLAQGWLVVDLTDESGASAPLWLGILSAVRAIGSTFLSPIGGVIIDRFDRRLLLVALQTFNMTTSLVLGTLVIMDWVQMWHLIVISLLQGIIMAISMPTRNAVTFDLAGRESLMNAMSANYLASDVMRIASPVIAGVITDLAGTGGAFFFLASSFIVATYCILRLPRTEMKPRPRRSVWLSLTEGASYACRNRNMRMIMVMDILMSCFAYSSQLMLPFFAREVLGVSATGLGVLMGVMGVGSLMTGVLIASSASLKPTHARYLVASLGYSAMVIGWAVSPWFALAALFLFLNGMASGGFNSLSSSLIQVVSSEEYRGRMIGLQGLTWGTMSLGGMAIGGAATFVSITFALSGLAAIPALLSVVYLVRAKQYSTDPEDQG